MAGNSLAKKMESVGGVSGWEWGMVGWVKGRGWGWGRGGGGVGREEDRKTYFDVARWCRR